MNNSLRNRKTYVIAGACAAAIILAIFLLKMASGLTEKSETPTESQPYVLPDTLRVGILNSPTTYFNYRGMEMGFDYEMVQRFAQDNKVATSMKVAFNFPELMEMLEKGEVDLIASPVPVTAEYRKISLTCGPKQRTTQMLIQPKGENMATDVTQLIGRHVTVEKDSKFEHRLRNLDSELGGGIVIETLAKDTLVSEDMIKMVADGEIAATVVDYAIARANLPDYPQLDGSLAISLDQETMWAVKPDQPGLAEILNKWTEKNQDIYKTLHRKYFDTAKLPVGLTMADALSDLSEVKVELELPEGKGISPFDGAFRRAAASSRFDWKLIAAVAYVESRFKTDLVSWAGAKGVMQIMPRTAKALGYSPEHLSNPETCISAGIKLLETLDKQLEGRVPDPNERINFVLAAYNAGLGHIYDSIALADKYGLAKNRWEGGVDKAALMKSHPQYYRDPVVKNGYFRGRETIDFVARVKTAYQSFLAKN